MMTMKRYFSLLAAVMLLACATALLNACGSDEPDSYSVQYFMGVENEFLVNGATRENNPYYDPSSLMKEAIQRVYPTPTEAGADDAVIAACDKCYADYVTMYTGYPDHLTCTITLNKATVDQKGIVHGSSTLRTYNFNINDDDSE